MKAYLVTRRDFGRILSGGLLLAAGNEWSEASVADATGGGFAFGVIADAQYCDAAAAGTRFYRDSPAKLADCVDVLNELPLAFVIHLGDLIDRDFRSFEVIVPIFDRIRSPRHHVLGNHDFSVAPDELDRVAAKLGLSSCYYSFQHHGWRFVVLDGTEVSLFAHREGSPAHVAAKQLYDQMKQQGIPQAEPWNGGIGPQQLAWLNGQLQAASRAGQKVIVFCHYPVYPAAAHNLWNDTELIGVLEAHDCVVAYINGHNHAGDYAVHHGIHYLTVPGMVETPDTTAFAVCQVGGDGRCGGAPALSDRQGRMLPGHRPTRGQLAIVGYGRTPGYLWQTLRKHTEES